MEIYYSIIAQSSALLADSFDFFADAMNYAITLYAVYNKNFIERATKIKVFSILSFGMATLATTIYRLFNGYQPEPHTISTIAGMAFLINLTCVFMLYNHRDGNANKSSIWVCSRNDVINNVAVFLAGLAIAIWQIYWLDSLVGLGMACLSFYSGISILRSGNKQHSH